MKTIFKNNTTKIVLNESTNEIHIKNVKSPNASLRIGVLSDGYNLTSNSIEYIPKSFNGLSGFNLKAK